MIIIINFKDLIKNQAEHNSELDKKLVEEIKSFYKKIQNNKQIFNNILKINLKSLVWNITSLCIFYIKYYKYIKY